MARTIRDGQKPAAFRGRYASNSSVEKTCSVDGVIVWQVHLACWDCRMMCIDVYYTATPLRNQSDFMATAIQRGSGNSLTATPENASPRARHLDGSSARRNGVIGTNHRFQDQDTVVNGASFGENVGFVVQGVLWYTTKPPKYHVKLLCFVTLCPVLSSTLNSP